MSKRTSRRLRRSANNGHEAPPSESDAVDPADRTADVTAGASNASRAGGGEPLSNELVTVAFIVAGLTTLGVVGVNIVDRAGGVVLIPDPTDRFAFDVFFMRTMEFALLPCGGATLLLWPVVEIVRRRKLPQVVTVGLGLMGGLAVLMALTVSPVR